MLLNLEGFKYATSLNLNMSYYHIRLIKEASNLCNIILPWGKYKYECPPMGVYNLLDIFQEKTNEIFQWIEFIRTYIDDLLTIRKGDWYDHLNKLELLTEKIRVNGLKCNIEKSFFWTDQYKLSGFLGDTDRDPTST